MAASNPSKDLWQYLTTVQKPVVLYGTGNGADKILDRLEEKGVSVSGVFASSDFVRNRTFRGMKVESFEDLHPRLGEMVVLICFGTDRNEVLENIDHIASICEVYAPDVPVYGTVHFDREYYDAHLSEIEKAKEMLCDELSRDTFDRICRYKISGDYTLLRACETTDEELASLIRLPDDARYIDLGAYNGDTVQLYHRLLPKIQNVIAVEPDKRNFRKLQENTSSLPISIRYVRALISDHDGQASVDRNKGRGTHEESVSGQNAETIEMKALVTLLREDRADLIKFDVEGNEEKAICGGREILLRDHPALIVSCYHRSEDIFSIPLLIKSIVPEYKVFLRHRPHLLPWNTEFIFTMP